MTIAALAIIGFGSTAFFVFRSNPEPEYEGKPLSYWLEALNRGTAPRATDEAKELGDKARAALRQIGTNAFPEVIAWTRYEPPKLVVVAAREWQWAPFEKILRHDFQRMQLASTYFSLMGKKASAAVPMLSNIVISARQTSDAASFARGDLQTLGTDGRAAIVSIMQNTNISTDVRINCLYTLVGEYSWRKRGRLPEVEGLSASLRQCITDPNEAFRAAATNSIKGYAPELLTNDPAKN